MNNKVILVDLDNNKVGIEDKIEAHKKSLLHRAFSIFIFNQNKEILLQKRAKNKYHSALLWTNTCCSHQRDGETNIEAGTRRLSEEMGFTTALKEVTTFIYKAPFDNGLTEHEFDHVMTGFYEMDPVINKEEVEAWKWMPVEAIKSDIESNSEIYTAWFKIIFKNFYTHINSER